MSLRALALAWCLAASPDLPPEDAMPDYVFMEAYVLKDANPERALKLFRWVRQHTQPGTPLFEKAKRWELELSTKP